MPNKNRDTTSYRKRMLKLKAESMKSNAVCHLCGQHFDWRADPRSAEGFTADHLDSVKSNGNEANGTLLPSHRGCNSSRGKKSLDEYVNSTGFKVRKPTQPTMDW